MRIGAPTLRIGAEVEDRASGGVGLAGSFVLHALIVAATVFTFQRTRLDILDQAPVVPVDLVSIADKTDIAPMVTERPKLEQQQIAPPKHDLVPAPLPALPEPSEVAPPDQAASSPVLPKPQPAPVPKPKPEKMAEKPEKKSEEDLSALLNKLTAPSAAPKNARIASRNVKGFGAQNAMTMDLEDSLRNQIEQCMNWGTIAGAPNARDIVVVYDLTLNQDGNPAHLPQLESQSAADASRDPYVRAAAEAARRAIMQCGPYKLPGERYDQWRDSEVRFSPRDIVGD